MLDEQNATLNYASGPGRAGRGWAVATFSVGLGMGVLTIVIFVASSRIHDERVELFTVIGPTVEFVMLFVACALGGVTFDKMKRAREEGLEVRGKWMATAGVWLAWLAFASLLFGGYFAGMIANLI